mgnify:CR=1 FL=1
MNVDDIPVAYTPEGGWTGAFPDPVLAGCNDPIVDGAPDMRGMWTVTEVLVDGNPVEGHPLLGALQRIEQAGNRVTITAGGIIHDMRCDGTLENGVHDVAEFDKTTEIHVVAGYEDGVHVLRPHGLDLGTGAIEIRRRREGPHLVWDYLGFTARLEHLAPSDTDPADIGDVGDVATLRKDQ